MGGIIIILSIIIPALLFGNLTNIYVQLLIVSAIWLGLIGFLDDSIKVFKKNKDGLSGKYKIIGQVTLGLVVGLALCLNNQVDLQSTVTTIPFVKGNQFDYAWLSPFGGALGEIVTRIIYVVVIIFVITAVSNGSNLTDGMDGLATGVSAFIGITIAILAYLSGNTIYASYLDIMYIPYSGEVVIFMSAFIGALVGFLWYNTYPAQVFMGDTGSLALGGIIAVAAIILKKELLIPVMCGIFLVESLSVIMQRYYFKYTKKKYGEGRRIFKMSPLHHHFQKEGIPAIIQTPKKALPEAKIVVRFWIITILLCAITIITLKIR
jgi:phospho-N-acetylmuramoyl-pentapeptide-transferase